MLRPLSAIGSRQCRRHGVHFRPTLTPTGLGGVKVRWRGVDDTGDLRAPTGSARAAKIEKALDLAATRPAPDRKAMLERVQARIDMLYAEVIRALIPDEGTGPEGTNDEEV